MNFRSAILVCLLALTGCATYNPPYVTPAPQESETYLERYEFKQGFNGVEVVVGLPFLGWIPGVGQYLDEMIQFRAGVRQDVLVPVMKESIYEHEARAAAARRGVALPPPGLLFIREREGLRGWQGGDPGVRR